MADSEAGGARRFSYEVVQRTSAPVSAVWPLLAHVDAWKRWSFVTRSFLVREGAPDPDGVGAVRRLAVGPFGSTEEVVAFEPPTHLGYVARRGMPARDYRADVVLSEHGTGTTITWRGSLEALVPGTGPLAIAYARSAVARFARQVARYAERGGS